jgi:hypothetical protein
VYCKKDIPTVGSLHVRVSARTSDHGFVYTLVKAGALVFTTGNRDELAERMASLGIEHPAQLIEAAEQWGVVELREGENPESAGG